MNQVLRTWVLVTLAIAPLAVPGHSQTYVELILDASGSMYNKLGDGRYRITAAKEVLRDFVAGLPDRDLHVGLRIYGSELQAKDQGSCRDSKLFVPMTGVDRPALLETITDTRARGSTPIAYSLEQAARDFPAGTARCAVILVTDGEEVCGGDVAAGAARLRQLGCELDLRIIGFDLTPEAIASFEGIGTFENATDAAALAAALDRAADQVVEREPLAAATLEAPDQVVAGSPFEVTWRAEAGSRDYVTIVRPDAPPGAHGSYAYTSDGNPVTLHAPIDLGTNELRYQSDRVDGVAARRQIEVIAAEVALDAPPEVPAGRPFEVSWVGPDGERDYVTMVEKSAADGTYANYKYTREGSPLKLHAPITAGEYELRYQSDRVDGVFARRPVTVTPALIVLDAPAEVAAGSHFDVQWQGPDGDRDYLTVVPADAPDGKYTSYSYTREGPIVDLVAPTEPGDYEVRYQSDREKGVFARIPITVTPLQASVEGPDRVAAGTSFEVQWTGPNGPQDYITIVKVGAAPGTYTDYRYTSEGSPVTLKAPAEPGDYEIRYQSDRVRNVIFASRRIRVR